MADLENKNLFKRTKKDIVFEKLIKELQPITRKSIRRDFGTSSKAKGSTNHTLEFNYEEYEVKVEMKEK